MKGLISHPPLKRVTLARHKWLVWATLLVGASSVAAQSVVISQVYGGGGNQGAPLGYDFIELFNRGTVAVDLENWSVQYASASGSSWDRTLLSGTVQPGQYYLIREGGSGNGVALPTPDATGDINLSAISGKVALTDSVDLLSNSLPSGASIIDFLGYGSANAAEGAPAPQLSNTTAAVRRDKCSDTNDNASDFASAFPTPHNTSSPMSPCAAGISLSAVVNAASYQSGAVAPGEIVTLFGAEMGPEALTTSQLTADQRHLTTELAGTQVLWNGTPSPLLYVSASQISAVVPYGVAASSTAQVQVTFANGFSNPLLLPVVRAAPGVFSLNSSGSGAGAILNEDYKVNAPSQPALPGSIISIYATGGGLTSLLDDGLIVEKPDLLSLPVEVTIGGLAAEVLYAGSAPSLVSGAVQVNVRVPSDVGAGAAIPLSLTVDGLGSQEGITVSVGSPVSSQDGVGPLIDQRLAELKQDPSVPPLVEIPNDRVSIPEDWLALISWNTQVGGTSTDPVALRPPMVQAALAELFSGTYQMLAAQEVPNSDSAAFLRSLLPGGATVWQSAFFDTDDSMDNGVWYKTGVTLRDAFPLFVTGQTDSQGRMIRDSTLSLHPPVVAQFQVNDFDFTLITVHLAFANGDSSESARELHNVLDYLDWYFDQPAHDPDVIVCGDFNMPSLLSGQTGSDGLTVDSVFDQDPRFQTGERRFVTTVHQPTSRSSFDTGGVPENNYDHCVLSADTMEEFIEARRVGTSILTDNPDDPEKRLTSDHFPIVAFFRTRGDGVVADHRTTLRPPVSLFGVQKSHGKVDFP
jgi:uncharacterized protein (TIGR03437 family)